MTDAHFDGEVHARMLAGRTISLFGRLDDELATRTAAELWTLDAEGDAPIRLLMSLNGGSVRATLALVDALDLVGVETRATCLGGISGPPIAAFAVATTRLAAPHARFRLEQEWRQFSGSASQLDAEVRHADEEFRLLVSRLSEATRGRRSVGDVLLDFERTRTLGAADAVEYGVVDELLSDEVRMRDERERPPFGFRPR